MPIIKQIRGEITMFWKRRPLQSRSEIWMRNLSMGFLVLYMGLFLIVPVLIVAVGSLHQCCLLYTSIGKWKLVLPTEQFP